MAESGDGGGRIAAFRSGDVAAHIELGSYPHATIMFTDALRGYAFDVLKRDGFRCRYCGLDGTASFASWLSLSWDHLLPKGHPQRDNPEYIVAACAFCNAADNHYFELAAARGLLFDGLSPQQLVQQRLPYVERTRSSYREFWKRNVAARHRDNESAA